MRCDLLLVELMRRHRVEHERYVQLEYENVCFYIDFLSAALDASEVLVYVEYATWAQRMLEARGFAVYADSSERLITDFMSPLIVHPIAVVSVNHQADQPFYRTAGNLVEFSVKLNLSFYKLKRFELAEQFGSVDRLE
jgi:hypothetical protein